MTDKPQDRARAEGADVREEAADEAARNAEDGAGEAGEHSARPRGVFGNLPRHRPGTRSPRRTGAERSRAGTRSASDAQAEPKRSDEPGPDHEPKPRAEPEPHAVRDAGGFTPPHDTWPEEDAWEDWGDPSGRRDAPQGFEPRPSETAPGSPERRGLSPEDLAWAAIVVAAQAATVGVRLVNRALDALLDRPEQR